MGTGPQCIPKPCLKASDSEKRDNGGAFCEVAWKSPHNKLLNLFFIYLFCVYMCECVKVRGQPARNLFSPSTMWGPGLELRSDLVLLDSLPNPDAP